MEQTHSKIWLVEAQIEGKSRRTKSGLYTEAIDRLNHTNQSAQNSSKFVNICQGIGSFVQIY
jgi:hypothetical protein